MAQDTQVVKLVTLLRRKPGMTMAQFVERYETVHARLGARVLSGYATRYVRRFMYPLAGDVDATDRPHDVVMEIWFPDRATLDRCMAYLTQADIAAEIAADEEQVFDRAATVCAIVDEHETALPPVA
ncbi:hypothetical protein GTZ99_12775 [Novosphingobium sp. FSY-8]|uniref:EthD domain-containing protein n=1 Tax=Novosphingobium ovatum TaxID=1908523 RepID=A0ABW9XFU4_9SPHN|nr:EthD domain-containing protein [Novosphingobium ovatum]NBC37423.1 hypothetical protein [Novosphingobium ovatum]